MQLSVRAQSRTLVASRLQPVLSEVERLDVTKKSINNNFEC